MWGVLYNTTSNKTANVNETGCHMHASTPHTECMQVDAAMDNGVEKTVHTPEAHTVVVSHTHCDRTLACREMSHR